MKPSRFDYIQATNVEEALRALSGTNSKILAGGQSLTPLLSMRLAAPDRLVDINHIADLSKIELLGNVVRIGATARHETVRLHPLVKRHIPLLAKALELVAHTVIRNRGTTVGSIAHADPASEIPSISLLLNAKMNVKSLKGSRVISAEEFYVGPLESSLREGEMIESVDFHIMESTDKYSCVEVSRRHGDYALAGVSAISNKEGMAFSLFAVNAVPNIYNFELDAAPSEVVGRILDQIDPEADIHATAEYRRNLVEVLLLRALGEIR